MRSHFRYSPEVLRAFSKAAEKKGGQAAIPNVVLLESTILTHGLPHPRLKRYTFGQFTYSTVIWHALEFKPNTTGTWRCRAGSPRWWGRGAASRRRSASWRAGFKSGWTTSRSECCAIRGQNVSRKVFYFAPMNKFLKNHSVYHSIINKIDRISRYLPILSGFSKGLSLRFGPRHPERRHHRLRHPARSGQDRGAPGGMMAKFECWMYMFEFLSRKLFFAQVNSQRILINMN